MGLRASEECPDSGRQPKAPPDKRMRGIPLSVAMPRGSKKVLLASA